MDEFTALKLGDVLALERVGLDTVEKERKFFNEIFGEDRVGGMIISFRHNAEILDYIIMRANANEIAIARSNRMVQRLFELRESYLQSDMSVELDVCEWIGFFCGAAVVTWKLVHGIAERENHEELKNLCAKCIRSYEDTLDHVSKRLYEIGFEKGY